MLGLNPASEDMTSWAERVCESVRVCVCRSHCTSVLLDLCLFLVCSEGGITGVCGGVWG